ncbi:hypothetical protein I317_00872 [Kwoniella heveanensis CBS 569]|nr:hypothetical protein I317_00872 [Kwoniella heveanensis CBS 569]
MPEKCGLDLTLHARFLRGAFFYTLLQTVIIMPILMPLHIVYSPSDIARTSMLRASVSSLVQSSGSRWLWVHALLIWYITITWTATLLWITWGALAYRRRQIDGLAKRVAAAREAKRHAARGEEGENSWSLAEDCPGVKRYRTLMVTNVPPDMRDEAVLRDYFDHYLHRHRVKKEGLEKVQTGKRKSRASFDALGKIGGIEIPLDSEVDEVILVRKLGTISSLRGRRQDVLRKLELAHVNLAKRVLAAVSQHIHASRSNKTEFIKSGRSLASRAPPNAAKTERLQKLTEVLGPFVDDDVSRPAKHATVWDALHSLPRELIDPYQSLTHLTSLFRDENAPLIDYLSTKLEYLTMLLNEARSRPLDSYPASSAAFITFKDAKTARLAHKILDNHPKRSLACHTTPAPDWTDILWPRLSKSVYKSEFVRSWIVFFGVWAFTLIWIFPVSLLCALASLTNIAGFIKPLQSFLNAHPKVASAITSLAPVILVALLTIAICPILLVIANKAETIVTRLGIHNSVLERFWKFLMVNGVVFFAIGQSAIEAYLTAFQNRNFDPLPIVASAFPTAAPYFASYILLQVAIQPFFEIFRFGLPTIVYVFGTRVSVIPRQRNARTEHPTFSHFSQVPQQLLGGAIMHLFMLLNPLVIPFSESQWPKRILVWKRQFTYVYGRLYETNGRRTSIRALRYSLDALALSQFVLFAFFILNKAKGHAIATGILFFITLIIKIIITRALKIRFKRLDAQEADILCPRLEGTNDVGEDDSSEVSEADNDFDAPQDQKMSSRFGTIKRSFSQWTGSLGYGHKPGHHRKPIPFDHLLFATLDSKFSFELPDNSDSGDTCSPEEPVHPSDETLRVVEPHPPLQPWEDIPPYHRARGYNDQPAYTDPIDNYLWLPRDPLSTLDLDDTVEMRLALTTSTGGAGKIGDWFSAESGEIVVHEPEEHLVVSASSGDNRDHGGDFDSHDHGYGRETPDLAPTSPAGNSERRLVSTPSMIGSEVNDTFSGSHLFRRHTHRAADALANVFNRPRNTSGHSDDDISLRTLSVPPTTMRLVSPPSPSPISAAELDLPMMARASTPSPISAQHETDPLAEAAPSTVNPVTPEPTRTGSGSYISFSATLGRSPSGRRPTRLRSNSSNRSGEEFLQSPSLNRERSLSVMSPQRSRSQHRTPSAMSSQQQKMLKEIMEEEERASKEARSEEHKEQDMEEEEVIKEQDKIRKASGSGTNGGASAIESGGILRRLTTTSRRDSETSRSNANGRPRFERADISGRSGRSSLRNTSNRERGMSMATEASMASASASFSAPLSAPVPSEPTERDALSGSGPVATDTSDHVEGGLAGGSGSGNEGDGAVNQSLLK